jgi:tRNA-dihydrouridine synthase A
MKRHLEHVDGVMLGRAAYQSPYLLAAVDCDLFAETGPQMSRHDAVAAMIPYCREQIEKGVPLQAITRHMLGLFQGLPGARHWRRVLSEEARTHSGDPALLFERALDGVFLARAA